MKHSGRHRFPLPTAPPKLRFPALAQQQLQPHSNTTIIIFTGPIPHLAQLGPWEPSSLPPPPLPTWFTLILIAPPLTLKQVFSWRKLRFLHCPQRACEYSLSSLPLP